MTHRADVARGRDVVARWCALAEQRLEYLTELFETGRWRRYHSEIAFLENIQEAKAAVEIWRSLATREATPDNHAVEISWLGRPWSKLPPVDMFRDQVLLFTPQKTPIRAESPPRAISMSAEAKQVCSDDAPSAPVSSDAAADPGPSLALDPIVDPAFDSALDPVMDRLTRDIAAIAERYPLLRNVM
jgi:uncharacterized repeat protein (TIGR03809 family)